LLEALYRPLHRPVPGSVEESDLNELINMSKKVLTTLVPEGWPRQPPGVPEDGDIVDDDPEVDPGTFNHSASAQVHHLSGAVATPTIRADRACHRPSTF